MTYPINATYGEASNDAEEAALVAQGCTIIVRTDLLPPVIPKKTALELHFADMPITDDSGKPITNNGVTVSEGKGNFASGYLQTPDHADLKFGSADFDIVLRVKFATLNNGKHQFLLSKGIAGNMNAGWYLMYESAPNASLGNIMLVAANNLTQINVNAGITDTANFHEIRLRRIDGSTVLYVNGVIKGSTNVNLLDTVSPLTIGAWHYSQADHRFTGQMESIVITKG